MVGGTVIEVSGVKGRPDLIFVDCQDRRDTCAIYVERNGVSKQIREGDSLWWQGHWAMWTPKKNRAAEVGSHVGLRGGVDYDIRIPRASYSGVKHPDRVDG